MDGGGDGEKGRSGWPTADLEHALILWKNFLQNVSPPDAQSGLEPHFDPPSPPVRYPAIDIVGRGNTLVITADLPGIQAPSDLHIQLTKEQLYVELFIGDKTAPGDVVHRLERPTGTISRRVALPEKVMPRSAKSSYKHGVLTILVNIDAKEDRGEGTMVNIDFE